MRVNYKAQYSDIHHPLQWYSHGLTRPSLSVAPVWESRGLLCETLILCLWWHVLLLQSYTSFHFALASSNGEISTTPLPSCITLCKTCVWTKRPFIHCALSREAMLELSRLGPEPGQYSGMINARKDIFEMPTWDVFTVLLLKQMLSLEVQNLKPKKGSQESY